MIAGFPFGSYLVCMFLPLGYILMAAGFQQECQENRRFMTIYRILPAVWKMLNVGIAFASVYAVLILLVYFAQTTTVRLESLSEQAVRVLDYQRGGLMFNYDLLGYGVMALSTFFVGLSMQAKCRADRWLKALLMLHGFFFFGCFILPMTGMFTGMSEGGAGNGGTIALLCWCAYFFPVSVLAYRHFGKKTP